MVKYVKKTHHVVLSLLEFLSAYWHIEGFGKSCSENKTGN